MSMYQRVTASIAVFVPSTSGAVVTVAGTGSRHGIVSWSARPLQLDGGAHLAALVGIFALALLGGGLVARNRYGNAAALTPDSEANHEEFLTDQERVCQLLEENGGRMKQSNIVDSVDWSKAKVSRLLADLEEDDEVTKLRLGRENLVCLPGHEPTASKSSEQTHKD